MAKARLSEDDVMFTSHDEKSLRSTVVEYYTDDQAKDVYSSSRMKLPTSDQGMSWSKNHFGRLDDAYDTVLTSLKAPGLRRIAIVTVCAALLIWIVWTRILWPWTEEDKIAWNILNSQDSERRIQFETSTRPQLGEIIQIKELDPTLLAGGPRADKSRRLIFIGDIHGCKEELLELLVKVKYDQNKDHIVSVGDIVNKGPDSLGVIDFLMEQGASAVRGNHDDKVIVLAEQHHKAKRDLEARRKKKHGPQGHDAIAHALSRKQLHYLQSFPLILKVGSVKRIGGMVVVHGGLVPGVALEAQDPETVMNMRSIDSRTHAPSSRHHDNRHSKPWFRIWSKYQKLHKYWQPTGNKQAKGEQLTVVYGHDAKMGLQVSRFAKGLDSSCARGGHLTALVVDQHGKEKIVQVSCKKDYTLDTEE